MAFYFDNFDLRIATVRSNFLHLRAADTTDKYLTLSRYTKQIYDRECKHMIAQRKQQTDYQNNSPDVYNTHILCDRIMQLKVNEHELLCFLRHRARVQIIFQPPCPDCKSICENFL